MGFSFCACVFWRATNVRSPGRSLSSSRSSAQRSRSVTRESRKGLLAETRAREQFRAQANRASLLADVDRCGKPGAAQGESHGRVFDLAV